jgi:hypothetical protein
MKMLKRKIIVLTLLVSLGGVGYAATRHSSPNFNFHPNNHGSTYEKNLKSSTQSQPVCYCK